MFQLREPEAPYYIDFNIRNDGVGTENSYLMNSSLTISK